MQVTVELGDLYSAIVDGCGQGLIAAREQMLSDCNQYCLQDKGTLMGSAIASFSAKSGEITWNTPYARRRYYEGTPRLGVNPNAKLHWAERAAEDFKETWAKQIAKGAGLK